MIIACSLLYGLIIVQSRAAGFVANYNIHGSTKSQTRDNTLHVIDLNNESSSCEVQYSKIEHDNRRLFLNSVASFGLTSIGFPFASVAEDGVISGGFGSAILEFASENKYKNDIKILGIPDEFIEHGSVDQLQHKLHLDITSLTNYFDLII